MGCEQSNLRAVSPDSAEDVTINPKIFDSARHGEAANKGRPEEAGREGAKRVAWQEVTSTPVEKFEPAPEQPAAPAAVVAPKVEKPKVVVDPKYSHLPTMETNFKPTQEFLDSVAKERAEPVTPMDARRFKEVVELQHGYDEYRAMPNTAAAVLQPVQSMDMDMKEMKLREIICEITWTHGPGTKEVVAVEQELVDLLMSKGEFEEAAQFQEHILEAHELTADAADIAARPDARAQHMVALRKLAMLYSNLGDSDAEATTNTRIRTLEASCEGAAGDDGPSTSDPSPKKLTKAPSDDSAEAFVSAEQTDAYEPSLPSQVPVTSEIVQMGAWPYKSQDGAQPQLCTPTPYKNYGPTSFVVPQESALQGPQESAQPVAQEGADPEQQESGEALPYTPSPYKNYGPTSFAQPAEAC